MTVVGGGVITCGGGVVTGGVVPLGGPTAFGVDEGPVVDGPVFILLPEASWVPEELPLLLPDGELEPLLSDEDGELLDPDELPELPDELPEAPLLSELDESAEAIAIVGTTPTIVARSGMINNILFIYFTTLWL